MNPDEIGNILNAIFTDQKVEEKIFLQHSEDLYFNSNSSPGHFLNENFFKRLSKRSRLRHFIGPKKRVSIAVPMSDQLEALKVSNGMLLVWGRTYFLKIATSDQAKKRLGLEIEFYKESPLQSFSWFPKTQSGLEPYPFVKMGRYRPALNPGLEVSALDKSLAHFFSDMQGASAEHGDFHINNIMLDGDNSIVVIDWDMVRATPHSMDPLSFFVHYFGFYVDKDYFKSLRQALNDTKIFVSRTKEAGFVLSSEHLNRVLAQESVEKRFLKQRIEWGQKNNVSADFMEKLKKLRETCQ